MSEPKSKYELFWNTTLPYTITLTTVADMLLYATTLQQAEEGLGTTEITKEGYKLALDKLLKERQSIMEYTERLYKEFKYED